MKKSPLKIIVAITLIVVVLVVLLVVLVNRDTESYGREFDEAPSIEGQPVYGDPDAPVTVVEFGDYKCPGCKAWDEGIFPQLEQDYIDNGDMQFSFVNVLFHGEESTLASLAAETVHAQDSEVYWDFHHALFDDQPENQQELWITPDKIEEIADGIDGIDMEALMEDTESNTLMDELIKDDDLRKAFEVESTPTIMVNNIMIEDDDTFDYEAIKAAIDAELGN
ncbi:DsbA family protein [Oceanobacillus neutriphilus]|uniref:Disulfide bond formation protein D n=1 Tax=Oceanobacillus neutriphilus TaxID=531815 RepID=A0ABQ2NP28_9BACI|nr:thioredoxin domain-containing protein [Oceanobacillus neutriphilus]GGP08207.1 disulfide bond formation protein D [Oceanobacillus neutriphilus]